MSKQGKKKDEPDTKESGGNSSMEVDQLDEGKSEQPTDSEGQDFYFVNEDGKREPINASVKAGSSTEIDEEMEESSQGKGSSSTEKLCQPDVILESSDEQKTSANHHKRSNNCVEDKSPKKLRQIASCNYSGSDLINTDEEIINEKENESVHLPSVPDINKVEEHHTAHRNNAIECNAKNHLNLEKRSDERKSNRVTKKKVIKKSSGSKKGTPNKEHKVSEANKESSDAIYADVEDNTQSSPSGTESETACLQKSHQQKSRSPDSHVLCDCSENTTNALGCSNKAEKGSMVDDDNSVPPKVDKVAYSTPSTDDEQKAQASGTERKMKSESKKRCRVCKKKLGLTAIKCRCGGIFCANHRYDKEHDCPFDYKALGAEEIRKNNPLIVAEKVSKL